ncbi:hypothetical protein [Arenibaculum pallidiluteum]|uniref:hypothetical protein n=1 Tax=Arenibaculum pallidiluteum TaxID=2812559 RepID=UPI001A95E95B|nr:hypothetical protein [Arenibaculum pallidiluteum]
MQIPTVALIGVGLALIVHAAAFLWFALRAAWQVSRVHSRIEALEDWRRTHSEAAAGQAGELREMVAEMARQGQALHDMKNWLQRIDSRLETAFRQRRLGAE